MKRKIDWKEEGKSSVELPELKIPESEKEKIWTLSFPGLTGSIWFVPLCIDHFDNQMVVDFFLKPEHYMFIRHIDFKNVEWTIQTKDKNIQFRPRYLLIQELTYHNTVRIKFGIPE
jgi:hypothetical protein